MNHLHPAGQTTSGTNEAGVTKPVSQSMGAGIRTPGARTAPTGAVLFDASGITPIFDFFSFQGGVFGAHRSVAATRSSLLAGANVVWQTEGNGNFLHRRLTRKPTRGFPSSTNTIGRDCRRHAPRLEATTRWHRNIRFLGGTTVGGNDGGGRGGEPQNRDNLSPAVVRSLANGNFGIHPRIGRGGHEPPPPVPYTDPATGKCRSPGNFRMRYDKDPARSGDPDKKTRRIAGGRRNSGNASTEVVHRETPVTT